MRATVKKDHKNQGQVFGRVIGPFGEEGKVVFFSSEQPPILEKVVLEKTEDKGKFIVCSDWRYANCRIHVFHKDADLKRYHQSERQSAWWVCQRESGEEASFLVHDIKEIQERIFLALRDHEHKYVFTFESEELARRFVPSVISDDFFVEEGVLWQRDFRWRRGDEFRMSGWEKWPTTPVKVMWLDENGRPYPGASGGKRSLVDGSEEVIRGFIETRWPEFERLSEESDDEVGLIGRYDDNHWVWVRHKSSGGSSGNWRMAYLFKGRSREDAFRFIQSWGMHRELAVLTTMPWVP